MAIVHLQSGLFEQASENEPSSSTPTSLTRRALLVYEGEFESMDGIVNVGRDELTTLATNHNGHIESASRLAEGKESMKDFPPVQLDHSTSAKDTVGRLIGKLELGGYKTKDGREVMAAYGNVKILGEENVVKVMDGRWTHLSVGVDFEKGKFSELTITPFPAAPEASLLKKNTETKLGPQDEAFKKYKNLWITLNTKMDDDDSEISPAEKNKFYNSPDPFEGQDQEDGLMDWEGALSDLKRLYRELSGKGKLSSKETEMSGERSTREEALKIAKSIYSKVAPQNAPVVDYDSDGIVSLFFETREDATKAEGLLKSSGKFKSIQKDGDSVHAYLSSKDTEMSTKRLASGWVKRSGVDPETDEEMDWIEKNVGSVSLYVNEDGGSPVHRSSYFWAIGKPGKKPWEETGWIQSGEETSMGAAVLKAESAAKRMGITLSEGDKSMDKDKMKKHMMEVQEMSEKDAEEKLAKCTEEEMKKLAAEVEEHEKKMAQEKPEEKKEMSEEKPEDKKEMSEAKEDEKKEMSKEEEKKDLAKEKDEDKEEMESSKEDKKLSAARERIVRLSSDFRKAFEGAQLAAKKGKIVSRLSALKSNAKITPAEIKKIDIEKLAGQGDETVDLVLKTYEDREPVVMTGALGSIKADELHRLSNEIKMSRLEAETRKNMSLLKHTVKTRMQEEKEGGEVSIHVDTTPHVDQEIEMAYGSVCKMMDEGKLAEAKELLKKYMMKPKSEGRMDMVEHDKQLSALAEESIKMQNKFDELQKLAVSLVG